MSSSGGFPRLKSFLTKVKRAVSAYAPALWRAGQAHLLRRSEAATILKELEVKEKQLKIVKAGVEVAAAIEEIRDPALRAILLNHARESLAKHPGAERDSSNSNASPERAVRPHGVDEPSVALNQPPPNRQLTVREVTVSPSEVSTTGSTPDPE